MAKSLTSRPGLDLFAVPVLGAAIKSRRVLTTLRLLCTLLLAGALYYGLTMPDPAQNKVTTGIFWGLFWPFFIVLSLPTIGPSFCSLCPHGFIGEKLNRIGLAKKIPDRLNNPFIGLAIVISAYWLVSYGFTEAFRSPQLSAGLFLLLTVFAMVCFFLFKDMAYCKTLCPIGAITKAFGRVSFVWLTTNKQNCSQCKSFDCAKSCPYHLQPFNFDKHNSMTDCTLCMRCAQACDSVQFKLVKPASSLWQTINKPRTIDVWVYIIMLGVITVTMRFHHRLGRSAIADQFIWSRSGHWLEQLIPGTGLDFTGLFALLYAMLLTLGVSLSGFYLAAKILKTDYQTVFKTLGYAMAPLMIVGGLSHNLESFFLHYYHEVANALIQLLHLPLDFQQALAKRGDSWLHLFNAFNYLAIAWSLGLLYKRMRLIPASTGQRILAFPFAGAMALTMIALIIYSGYVFSVYGAALRHHMH